MHAWELRWADVDPSTHAFDIARVAPVVETIVQGTRDRGRILSEVEKLVVEAYGDWARSWTWAVNNGGPVRHFCCSTHSVLPDRENKREPTIRRIVDAIADWRAYLVELDELFREIDRTGSPGEIVERAAPQIYNLVVARTSYEDAWYGTFERAMGWFAETVVYDTDRVRALVDATVSGRFTSWTGPTDAVRDETFLQLALDVETLADATHEQIDGTAAWLAIRPSAFTPPPGARPFTKRLEQAAPAATRPDGHEQFIATYDARRGEDRASQMASALALCRDAAQHHLPLAFDQLAEWQAVILGASQPVELRPATAYAKLGRERYPLDDGTRARFDRALADANDTTTPVAVRAARVYLDVCFFHPFSDGNSRAARLALDHVLTRAGLALYDGRGIFTLSRAAGDPRAAWSLAAAIDRVVVRR